MEEGFEQVRKNLPRSFSDEHEDLLRIVFDVDRPSEYQVRMLPDSVADIRQMELMVKVEFAEALKKETKKDNRSGDDPKPYDVFVVSATMECPTNHLAVYLPTNIPKRNADGSRADGTQLLWYRGGDTLLNKSEIDPLWRVASLSGPVRVLQALATEPNRITNLARRRTGLQSLTEHADEILTTRLASLRECSWELEKVEALLARSNESQKSVIATAIDPDWKEGFCVVQGPPGCGKTTTIVTTIAMLPRDKQVLVTAPSNAAVANIALKLFATGLFDHSELCVYGRNCDKSVGFLNPAIRGEMYARLCKACREVSSESRTGLIKEFQEWLHLPSFNLDEDTLEEMGRLCQFIDLDTTHGMRMLRSILAQSRVLFATMNSCGSSPVSSSTKANTVIMDEAGQSTEAEFNVVTNCSTHIRRILLVGDPKQLPATVLNRRCEEAKYGNSWMAKVHRLYPGKILLLDTQYRMHPDILQFPNLHFYGNRIQTDESVLQRDSFNVQNAVTCIDTRGLGREAKREMSYNNEYEAHLIARLLERDDDIQRVVRGTSGLVRVMIITPYSAQVDLIKRSIELISSGFRVDVGTVDSNQGQEADVVIISMVRTVSVGFVGDPHRINVAITRAKRVLRIVGDASFFLQQQHKSVLRRLFRQITKNEGVAFAGMSVVKYSKPDWNIPCIWKVVMSSSFMNCVKQMAEDTGNICLHVLHAVATAQTNRLGSVLPERKHGSWHTSWLKNHAAVRVVWIARSGAGLPIVEAHFAGNRDECLRFQQLRSSTRSIPSNASVARPDLLGLHETTANDSDDTTPRIGDSCWPLNELSQGAMEAGLEPPLSAIQLDACQEEVTQKDTPLLIESRSGTGKTLVLLQHAARNADARRRSACFLTASTRLSRHLSERYAELVSWENTERGKYVFFFSFDRFLDIVVARQRIRDFDGKSLCWVSDFLSSVSHSAARKAVDSHLVQNEIGGVITGSLEAATSRRPLSRSQYMTSKRSNLPKNKFDGSQTRSLIYDIFVEYQDWKKQHRRYDSGDVVLRLLHEDWKHGFAMAYLDEVQDLSYAAIFLICSIAGKKNFHWVFAGDPAQMISPGCAFTFAGLKDVLMAIDPTVLPRLRDCQHRLRINYRAAPDIVELGNDILQTLHDTFPDAIGFVKPEQSGRMSIHARALLCTWTEVLDASLCLSPEQAVIYTNSGMTARVRTLLDQLNDHPFAMSSLESKGLEFNDVIVAFDVDRSTLQVEKASEKSLKMLQELYVAVTRAHDRVVVMYDPTDNALTSFLARLGYEFDTDSSIIHSVFQTRTTKEEWFDKGSAQLEDMRFKQAVGCFRQAGRPSWEFLARGLLSKHGGQSSNEAVTEEYFREALRWFHEEDDMLMCLRAAVETARASNATAWADTDNGLIKGSLHAVPPDERQSVTRADVVLLHARMGDWHAITDEDFRAVENVGTFLEHRKDPRLCNRIKSLLSSTRNELGTKAPVLLADYYSTHGDSSAACNFYLLAGELKSAEAETWNCLGLLIADDSNHGPISAAAAFWLASSARPRSPILSQLIPHRDSPAWMCCLALFHNPRTHRDPLSCLEKLGRDTLLTALRHHRIPFRELHRFGTGDFFREIVDDLETDHEPLDIYVWFLKEHADGPNASKYVLKRGESWSLTELVSIVCVTDPSRAASASLQDSIIQVFRQKQMVAMLLLVHLCAWPKQKRVDHILNALFSRPKSSGKTAQRRVQAAWDFLSGKQLSASWRELDRTVEKGGNNVHENRFSVIRTTMRSKDVKLTASYAALQFIARGGTMVSLSTSATTSRSRLATVASLLNKGLFKSARQRTMWLQPRNRVDLFVAWTAIQQIQANWRRRKSKYCRGYSTPIHYMVHAPRNHPAPLLRALVLFGPLAKALKRSNTVSSSLVKEVDQHEQQLRKRLRPIRLAIEQELISNRM